MHKGIPCQHRLLAQWPATQEQLGKPALVSQTSTRYMSQGVSQQEQMKECQACFLCLLGVGCLGNKEIKYVVKLCQIRTVDPDVVADSTPLVHTCGSPFEKGFWTSFMNLR